MKVEKRGEKEVRHNLHLQAGEESHFHQVSHLDSVSDIVQHAVVDWLPDVSYRSLRVGRSNDLVRTARVLVGGQGANLSPCHLLLVNVNCLRAKRFTMISK